MIPVLYEANETAFRTQGLGSLADAISVSVSRVINGKDELTMVYPSTGARYSDLVNDRIIFAVPEYKKEAQPYQIYKITKPLNGRVTVYARHVGSQRTQYIPVTPYSAGSLTEALNSLPNHLAESCPFTFWTNKTVTANFNLTRPASLGKVLGGMEGSLLDVYGGEYEFDGYTIKLWNRRGHDSGVELRYGKNITDIEHSEDFASIVTGVVPYWEGMDGTVVSLPEVVIEGRYADTYSFRRTIVKDFSDRFDEQPTQEQLRSAATSYVNRSGIGTPNINLKVSFEHLAQYTGYENLQLLEQLNLGDTVSIYYEPLNISASARIANTVYDCLNDKYTSVQIGSVRSDMEQVLRQVTNETAQAVERVQKDIPSALVEAVENATDLITGANGGFVVIDRDANGKPYQILIMDTDNKATATNVIRINQNGIGFSTSGYSGPFTTAWTIDGNFVADFITTGVLNAALAKIGVLADAAGKNSWNMETGLLNITNGKIVATFTRTFSHSDYSSSDITTARELVISGTWTDEQLEKYDINLDGDITMADVIKVRNMVDNGTDETVTIRTEIDPSKTSRSIAIYNGTRLLASLSPNSVYGQSGMFEKKVVAAGSWIGENGVLKLNGSLGQVYIQAGAGLGITFYDANNTQTGRIGSDCKDYIKEQGTARGWSYRKWNSGIYECWRTISTSPNINTAWGNQYYGIVSSIDYPVTFTARPYEVATLGTTQDFWGMLSANSDNSNIASRSYAVIRPNRSTDTRYSMTYYVKGTI